MLVVISPAKKLDFDSPVQTEKFTVPENLNLSQQLINSLRRLSKKQLSELMNLSANLTDLNTERYASWSSDFTTSDTKQALLAFRGDVFQGMKNDELSKEHLEFAQEHLRILSGLHGILRPLDLIKPYRLEMGTKLPVNGKKNLYQFWGDNNVNHLNNQLDKIGADALVNLASAEYFKSINLEKLKARVITPVFKDMKNGTLKVIFLYAKQARGMMAGYIIRNGIVDPEGIKTFDEGGYRFTENLSDDNTWVFTR
ncbi:peroxide stress protein YaaA [Bacteroidota bacterium]